MLISFCVCLVFLISCNDLTDFKNVLDEKKERPFSTNSISSIREAIANVRDGDLAVRCGRDFTSQSLRKLNRRDTRFSHCGLVRIEQNQAFIYHAMGGEFNPTQALIREPLVDFVNPNHEICFAIFRLDSTLVSLERTFAQIDRDYQNKLPFDMDFDLNTTDRMYCSEWVAHCLQKGLNHSMPFNISQIGSKSFIGVDDIFLHPAFNKIKYVTYE